VGSESPGGKLWHTTRNPNGSWQPTFTLLGPASQTGEFVDVACGFDGLVLHVLAIKLDGSLWHISRSQQGWDGAFEQITQSSGVPAFIRVGCGWPDTYNESQPDPQSDHDWEGPDEDDDEEDEEHEEDEEEDEDEGRLGKPRQPKPSPAERPNSGTP
jgi:hypothetical protein